MLTTSIEIHRDRRLRVARLGQGPPLILLHGYPDNLQIWSPLAPLLANSFEVIAFDWPGMGQSDPWPGGATPFHMAERVLTLLDDWKIGKATLVGMDMGGQPALAFAARFPERIQSLIVMNSLVQWNEETSWEIAVLRRFGWNRLALCYLPRTVFRRAVRTSLPNREKLEPRLQADLWQSFQRREVRDFIIRLCAGYQGTLPHLATLYPTIQTPTLALWAEHDKHFPPQHGRGLQAQLPNATFEMVRGAEHWMPLTHAQDIVASLRRFLRGEGDSQFETPSESPKPEA
jgi:pimeloyl-ACP methyl ester carboxylesterase